VIREAGGVTTRLGDETIGEMWSLADGKNVLNEIDPRFSENMSGHIADPYASDPFHVSADTDPKADRSKRPQEQDPDFLVHVVTETGAVTQRDRSRLAVANLHRRPSDRLPASCRRPFARQPAPLRARCPP
jgi:4-hydroxyphenylacetate 3-hydroxylase N terminal